MTDRPVLRNFSDQTDIPRLFDARFLIDEVLEGVVLPTVSPSTGMPDGCVVRVRTDWWERFPFTRVLPQAGCAYSWAALPEIRAPDRAPLLNLLKEKIKTLPSSPSTNPPTVRLYLGDSEALCLLVHAASPITFDGEDLRFPNDYLRLLEGSRQYHDRIWTAARSVFGPGPEPAWMPHDTAERDHDTMILRKGATRALTGQFALLVSSDTDSAIMLRATPNCSLWTHSLPVHTGGRVVKELLPCLDPYVTSTRFWRPTACADSPENGRPIAKP